MTDERDGIISGSAFGAFVVACPGQRNFVKALNLPGEAPDPWTERGTRIHSAWAGADPSGLEDDERADFQRGIDFASAMYNDWRRQRRIITEGALMTEERFWLNHPSTFEPLLSGQPDYALIGEDRYKDKHALILDYKSGFCHYIPPAESSWQLRCYAVLLDQNHDHLHTIRVAYVKPKSKADPTDYVDYNRDELDESLRAILYHIWEASQPEAQRHAGEHCRFCPAKGHCPEAGAMAMLPASMVATKFPQSITKDNIPLAVEAMPIADVLKIWDASTVINQIVDACDARLKALPKAELEALGLELKSKKHEPITDFNGAYALMTSDGMHPEQIARAASLAKGELVNVFKEFYGFESKAEAERMMNQRLEPFITRGFNAPSLRRKKD